MILVSNTSETGGRCMLHTRASQFYLSPEEEEEAAVEGFCG